MSNALSLAHVFRVFRDLDVHVLERDEHEAPMAVCIKARSASECQATLPLLAGSPASFVLFNGICYFPDGSKRPYDPTRPNSAAELGCQFDIEWIESGPPPRVTLFTYTEQEWENAKQAVCHLLQSGKLSPQSSIETSHAGHKQGFFCI